MATFNYTTREFREKQALILDKVDAGEDIIIHRGIKKSYMLVPVHKEDYTISEEFREKIAKAREDYKAGKGVTCKTIEQSMSLLESLQPMYSVTEDEIERISESEDEKAPVTAIQDSAPESEVEIIYREDIY